MYQALYGPEKDVQVSGEADIALCPPAGRRVLAILGGTSFIGGVFLSPGVGGDGCVHVRAYGVGTVPAGSLVYMTIVAVEEPASGGGGETGGAQAGTGSGSAGSSTTGSASQDEGVSKGA